MRVFQRMQVRRYITFSFYKLLLNGVFETVY
jgi:hypothetical protein